MGLRYLLWSRCRSNLGHVLYLSWRLFRWCPFHFFHFFFAAKKQTTGTRLNKTNPSKDLMFWKVVRHPIELLQVLNSLIASSSTFLQLKHEAALVFSQPTVVPILLDFGNLTGMDPTQRQVLEARARVRGSFWKGRKGSSCFFCCFPTVVRLFIWIGVEVSFNVRKSCANILKESNNNTFSNL